MPSLYAQYLSERTPDIRILETENGFATYEIVPPEVYIRDLYVVPGFRKAGVASELANQVADEARRLGCTYMTGTVDPSAQGAHTSMLVLVGYGMRLLKIDNGSIVFVKEL